MSLELKELKAPDFILNGVDELLAKAVFILNDNDASDGLIEQWVNKCLWQAQGCYFAYKGRQLTNSIVFTLKEKIAEIYTRREESKKDNKNSPIPKVRYY